jgi:hypothetical protein
MVTVKVLCEDVSWIYLALDKDMWRAVVDMLLSLLVP